MIQGITRWCWIVRAAALASITISAASVAANQPRTIGVDLDYRF
jgi:hypothetical protein